MPETSLALQERTGSRRFARRNTRASIEGATVAGPRRNLRADIQGLRALAVGLVIAFHAGVPGFDGGFVGVDVFFVISGFLISSHLLRIEAGTGLRPYVDFYGRRILRLLPVAALVLVVTMVLVRLMLVPLEWPAAGETGRSSALYYVNIFLANENTAYLSDASPSPFQQYWSLAVEEQFYLFWPALLALVSVVARRRSDRMTALIAVIGLASLAYCIYMTPRVQPFAFFKLQSRAWEFALGALLALVVVSKTRAARPRPTVRDRRLVAGALAWTGLAMILASALTYDARTQFPGKAALLPVVGTALVIAGGSIDPRWGIDSIVRNRPLQWVGLVSYSLYLWHWPVLIVPELASDQPLNGGTRAALAALTVVLAALSFRYVERTVREAPRLRARSVTPFIVGIVLTVVAALSATVLGRLPQLSVDTTLPQWPAGASTSDAPRPTVVGDNLQPSLSVAASDQPVLPKPTCTADFFVKTPVVCVAGEVSSTRTVVLVGDSHAQQWFPALDTAAREQKMRLVTLLKVSCPMIDLDSYNARLQRRYTECTSWRAASLAKIRQLKPAVIVVGNFHGSDISLRGASRTSAWAKATGSMFASFPSASRKVLLADGPQWPNDPADCLSDSLSDASHCSAPLAEISDQTFDSAEIAAAREQGATVADMAAMQCPSGKCPTIMWNTLVYRDKHHVTATFAKRVAPVFVKVLAG